MLGLTQQGLADLLRKVLDPGELTIGKEGKPRLLIDVRTVRLWEGGKKLPSPRVYGAMRAVAEKQGHLEAVELLDACRMYLDRGPFWESSPEDGRLRFRQVKNIPALLQYVDGPPAEIAESRAAIAQALQREPDFSRLPEARRNTLKNWEKAGLPEEALEGLRESYRLNQAIGKEMTTSLAATKRKRR